MGPWRVGGDRERRQEEWEPEGERKEWREGGGRQRERKQCEERRW